MAVFSKRTKEQAFWRWFEENENDLYYFEKDREAGFDRLSELPSHFDEALRRSV